jgi:hypothetical protein
MPDVFVFHFHTRQLCGKRGHEADGVKMPVMHLTNPKQVCSVSNELSNLKLRLTHLPSKISIRCFTLSIMVRVDNHYAKN